MPCNNACLLPCKRSPGVASAAYSNTLPLNVDSSTQSIYAPGTTVFDQAHTVADAYVYSVSPSYFATVGTPLSAGRTFSAADTKDTPPVAIINRTLAHLLFGAADPIGRTTPIAGGKLITIVGVVPDGKYLSLTEDASSAIFRPLTQRPDSTSYLLARSDRPTAEMTTALRKAVASVDPQHSDLSRKLMARCAHPDHFPHACGNRGAGHHGAACRHACAYRHLWGGQLHGYASHARTGDPCGPGRANPKRADRPPSVEPSCCLPLAPSQDLPWALPASRLLAAIVYHATAADPLVPAHRSWHHGSAWRCKYAFAGTPRLARGASYSASRSVSTVQRSYGPLINADILLAA